MKIAILGAEGTGKTYLAQALTAARAEHAVGFVLAVTTDASQTTDSDLILLMGLDCSRAADESDPDGLLKLRRLQEDASLRQALQAAGLNYVVIYGQGPARTERALQAILQASGRLADPSRQRAPASSPWQWHCDKCSDGACEHRMFTGRLKLAAA